MRYGYKPKEFLQNPGMDELSLEKVERKLHEIFPEAYGEEGETKLSTDNVDLMGHPDGASAEQSSIGNEDAAVGDMLAGSGDFGGSFMNDGSTEAMMDQVNPNAFGPGENDSFMDELNSPDDQSGDIKFGGTAVSDEENIANSLSNIS